METNKKIAAKTVRRNVAVPDLDEADAFKKQQVLGASISRRQDLTSTTDKIAGDKFYYKNWGVKELQEAFPQNKQLWYVEKMYPYAQGSKPMYFDEPVREWEIAECKLKAVVMKKAGFRYAYVVSHMGYGEIFEQLDFIPEVRDGLDIR